MVNVQGSFASAGSGEFHVYKANQGESKSPQGVNVTEKRQIHIVFFLLLANTGLNKRSTINAMETDSLRGKPFTVRFGRTKSGTVCWKLGFI